MTVYEITQETEDGYDDYVVFNFRCDLSQADCPVEIECGSEWDATPFQVADGRHDAKQVAELLMKWHEGDWYSMSRPCAVREVSDGCRMAGYRQQRSSVGVGPLVCRRPSPSAAFTQASAAPRHRLGRRLRGQRGSPALGDPWEGGGDRSMGQADTGGQ